MASPRLQQARGTPVVPRGEPRSPGSRVLRVSAPPQSTSFLADEAIWKRLREAGFDDEMINRRDKAALIAYITKLETEMYDYQHHMGLLILERKEWTSKYEQLKASVDSAEIVYKSDHAAHLSALAEARKQEETVKKALGIEKECVANLEKALHEMRSESAETKVAAESKLGEARIMVENAQKKFDEAKSKLRAAESLHAEASRYDSTVTRKLQEAEAREDELRRRRILFKSECDAKERDLSLERQSLYDSQKNLQQEQEKLLEGQSFLNQREEYIFERSQELSRLEKELETVKANFDKELLALQQERSNMGLDMEAIKKREEAIIKTEALLDRREKELLILQERLACKEHEEIQRHVGEHQSFLEKRKSEFEVELARQHKTLEDEIQARRLSCELREADLNHREEVIRERENALELRLNSLAEREVDAAQTLKFLVEKEQSLISAKNVVEKEMLDLQKEREEIERMNSDLEKVKDSLEDEEKQLLLAQEKLEVTVAERNELLVLETRLKEEIDSFRAQQMQLTAEADKLKAEKEKFENEWELIDERREELRREAEQVAEERKSVCKYLKNEHDSLKLEKEDLRKQFKNDVESLSREREEFICKMEREHSEWFSRIQKEREDFEEDIKIQKKELENCISKRREEIETYLREREEAFEQEKAKELRQISSQKEMIAEKLEHVESEMKRLEIVRKEIVEDRQQREREWEEIKSSICELNTQREKLQKLRELLHADREDIYAQFQHCKEMENLNIASEYRALSEIQPHDLNTVKWKVPLKKCSDTQTPIQNTNEDPREPKMTASSSYRRGLLSERKLDSASPPISLTLNLVRKCAELIFRRSPEKVVDEVCEKKVESKFSIQREMTAGGEFETPTSYAQECKYPVNDKGIIISKLENFQDTPGMSEGTKSKGRKRMGRSRETLSARSDLKEPKVILEVLSSGVNAGNVSHMEHKNSTDKMNIARLKNPYFLDTNGETSNIDNGVNAFPVGRKRLKSSLSHGIADVHLEPSQKYQKRAHHKISDGAPTEDITSNCVVSMQMLFSDDENGPKSLDQTSGGREVLGACLDDMHEVFAKHAEISHNTSVMHCENLENGGSHGNGIFSSSREEILMPQEKVLETASSESEEKLSKQSSVSPAKLIAYISDKLNKQNDANHDNIVEVDEEDEDKSSVKEKLWNFLIT